MSTNNLASSAQEGRGRIPQGRTQALASISVYPDLESPGLSISGWKAAEEMGFCKIEFGTWHNGACTTAPNSTSDGFYILDANGRRSHFSQVSLKGLEPQGIVPSPANPVSCSRPWNWTQRSGIASQSDTQGLLLPQKYRQSPGSYVSYS